MRLNELVRRYTEQRFRLQMGEYEVTQRRFCEYYARLLNEKLVSMEGSERDEALHTLGAEARNLLAAWHWSVSYLQSPEDRPYLESLAYFAQMAGDFMER
jgi:hypothetical protein